MRTTLDLDDELMRAARKLAAERETTLTAILEEALRQLLLQRGRRRSQPFRLRLLIKKGRALAGVDLADRDSLYERMEGRG